MNEVEELTSSHFFVSLDVKAKTHEKDSDLSPSVGTGTIEEI
jgi:hypothetical protein